MKTFRHQEYELHCSARPVDGGKYVAKVVVSKQVWPTRPREIDVRRGDYATQEDAIQAAFADGVEWIHNYG